MAVTKFEGGFLLAAAGDTASPNWEGGTTRNSTIKIDQIVITKTTAGTVTFKDGNGVVVWVTHSLGNGSVSIFNFGGVEMSGLELDAVSAGSATVAVFASEGPSRQVGV
jgi:hypothetical protein